VATPSKRLSAAETRDLLVQEGHRLLLERGSNSDPIGVELSEAIANSEVPRSSAYRAFKHDTLSAQEAFTEALAMSLISAETHGDTEAVTTAALTLLASEPEIFDDGSPEELAVFLRKMIRVVISANIETLQRSKLVWVYLATLASVGQTPDPANHPLAPTLRSADRTDEMVGLYRDLAELFGLRLRTGWTWSRLDAAVSACVMGTGARMGLVDDLSGIMRATGPGGEIEEWSACGALVEGLMMVALEPNPRVKNAADLRVWLD